MKTAWRRAFGLIVLAIMLTACGGGGGGDNGGTSGNPGSGGSGGGGGGGGGGGTPPTYPTWSVAPAAIYEGTDSRVYETQLVYDDTGDGMAVWVAIDSTNSLNTTLMYSRYDGLTDMWSAPLPIDNSSVINAMSGPGHEFRVRRVTLAVDETNGNVFAVWFVTTVGVEGKVMAATYVNATGNWTTPEVLNFDELADARAIAVSSNGGVTVAAWLEVDDQTADPIPEDLYGVYASVVSGTTWGTPEKIDEGSQVPYTPSPIGWVPPTPLVDSNGNITVVFNYATTTWGVWTAERPNGGAWQTPVRIDSGDTASHQDLSATVTDDDTFHAVWVNRDATTNDVVMYSRRGASDMTWSPPIVVESRTGDAHAPVFAGNSSGDGVVAWVNIDGTTDLVVSHLDKALGQWGAAVNVGTGVPESLQPQVTMDFLGNIGLAWRWINLWYSVYTPTDGWMEKQSIPGGRHGIHHQFAWKDSASLSLIWAYNESGNPSSINISSLE